MTNVLLFLAAECELVEKGTKTSFRCFILSGCGEDWSKSLLFIQWGRGAEEVSLCHHWCWVGNQAWQVGGNEVFKSSGRGINMFVTIWVHIYHMCPGPRSRSSPCSVSDLRWRAVWSLFWWRIGGSLQKSSSSTAGQILHFLSLLFAIYCFEQMCVDCLFINVCHSLASMCHTLTCAKSCPFPFCSTYGLDQDSVINQYITTLLLLQEDEEGAGDPAAGQEEVQPLSHADALERVLQIIPVLHSTSELTDSLCAAIFKVWVWN